MKLSSKNPHLDPDTNKLFSKAHEILITNSSEQKWCSQSNQVISQRIEITDVSFTQWKKSDTTKVYCFSIVMKRTRMKLCLTFTYL